MMRVTATTETLQVADEALGLQIVMEANRQFPYGAFILRDGIVRATSSVALNPLCRGMLTAFHQAVLIQATVAHEVAISFGDAPGATVSLASSHPQSGPREDPDELLEIYSGEVCSLPLVEGPDTYLSSARPIYRRLLLDGGLGEGFSNDKVDFFNDDGLDVAVGTTDDEPLGHRFRPWTCRHDQVPQPWNGGTCQRGQFDERRHLAVGSSDTARTSSWR